MDKDKDKDKDRDNNINDVPVGGGGASSYVFSYPNSYNTSFMQGGVPVKNNDNVGSSTI
ncbi:TPA: hypothetical protein RQN60_003849, partial [Aeromonas dhakensis]|nr:hypothetical protein [Aeromonas dhakensis]